MQPYQYGQNYPQLGSNQPGPNQGYPQFGSNQPGPNQNYPQFNPNQPGPNQGYPQFGSNQPGPHQNYPQLGSNQPGPGPNNQNGREVYNELTKKQMSELPKLVSPKENIFYAGVVDKVNKHQTVQRRMLVITDKALYNIDNDVSFFESIAMCHAFDGYIIRRKINITKIFGATISSNPAEKKEQFIVHVQGEYDYLFNGGPKRDRIIKSLINAHFAVSPQPFVLFVRDETNISKFRTTDDDVKAKQNKRPKDGQILVTPDIMKNGLEWIIFNKNTLAQKPDTMNNGFNMPHSNQGNFGGAPYGGPYNGPGNFPGPYGQNQGPYPNAGGSNLSQNGQGSFYGPGPQSYQPYPQGPYPNMNLPPQQTNYNQYNQQGQVPGAQFNVNQVNNEPKSNGTQPNGNSPTNPNTSPNVNEIRPTPVNSNTQAQAQAQNPPNFPNYPISRSPTLPYNQYNNNYPPQNQNYGGQWNGRNF